MKWAGLALLAALIGGGWYVSKPRGIRNNNPGNIRHGDSWQGMKSVQTDPDFVQFVAPEFGIRALAIVLKNYSAKHGINTVAGIIDRWAPPSENDTQSYINAVAEKLGVTPEQPINVRMFLPQLAEAIIYHENGQQPYSSAVIDKGVSWA